MQPKTRALFIAQGFDGIEICGLHGGAHPEHKANADRDDEPSSDRPGCDPRIHFCQYGNQHDGTTTYHNANEASEAGEGHGFEQKLPSDGGTPCAKRFGNTRLAGSLSDGNEHNVHHAHAPDQESDRTQDYYHDNSPFDDVIELLRGLTIGLNEEIVRLVVGNVSPAAQNIANFIYGGVHFAGIGEEANEIFVGRGIELAERVIRKNHAAIFVIHAERAGGPLEDADYEELRAVHVYGFADGVFDVAVEGRGYVFADVSHIVAMAILGIGEKAAGTHGGV